MEILICALKWIVAGLALPVVVIVCVLAILKS